MYKFICSSCINTLKLMLGLTLFIASTSEATAANEQTIIDDSIVKIYVTSKSHSTYTPWNTDTLSASGSGFIIEGQRIITNAHVVSNPIFVEIQRDNNPKRYEAKIEAISHELDIAILTLKDAKFFTKGKPLPLGDLPDIHQEVMVYGYPVGGDTLSTTRGIVSRIEYLPYYHSGMSYAMIQIDAAVNAGNSGGPVISEGKVIGVVTQKAEGEGENIGYIIPTVMVKRFLKDMEDKHYDGLPAFSVQYENLLSPALKKKYKLTDEQTGVLINRVCANTTADKILKIGDVITHIDGRAIDDDGTSILTAPKTINFLHYIDLHQLKDTVKLDIIRDGQPMKLDLLLDEKDKADYHDNDPRYFIYGGFVFSANETPDNCLSREKYAEVKQKNKKDEVSITQVLNAASNIGFHDLGTMKIEKINGRYFDTFEEFYRLLQQTTGQFIELEDSNGYEIAIDRQLAMSEQAFILEQYHIQQAQSKDVAQWMANTYSGTKP